MSESRYIPGPLAVGSYVKFRRQGRRRGERAEWDDAGRITSNDAGTYVIESGGELFIRRFDEVDRMKGDEHE